MSSDSFWTSDTNNLSFLLNAINEKIFLNNIPLDNKNNKENNKNENNFQDLSLNKNIIEYIMNYLTKMLYLCTQTT